MLVVCATCPRHSRAHVGFLAAVAVGRGAAVGVLQECGLTPISDPGCPQLKNYYSPIWIAMRWYKARAFMIHHKTSGAVPKPETGTSAPALGSPPALFAVRHHFRVAVMEGFQ